MRSRKPLDVVVRFELRQYLVYVGVPLRLVRGRQGSSVIAAVPSAA